MDITRLAVNPAATSAPPGSTAEAAQLMMLRKAMDIQTDAAAVLLQALPAPTPLATSGPLGRTVNTYA